MDEQKRVFLAMALSVLIYFSWQHFYPTTGPQYTTGSNSSKDLAPVEQGLNQVAPVLSQTDIKATQNITKFDIQLTTSSRGNDFEADQSRADLTNMLELKSLGGKLGAINKFSTLTTGEKSWALFVEEKGEFLPLVLDLVEKLDDATVLLKNNTLGVSVKIELKDSGKLFYEIKSQFARRYFFEFYGLSQKSESGNKEPAQYLLYSRDIERFEISKEESFSKDLSWVGLDFDYHLFAHVFRGSDGDKTEVSSEVRSFSNGVLRVSPSQSFSDFSFYHIFTRKEYDLLSKEVGDQLHMSIDYGIFGVLAVPILWGLKKIYDFVPNYALAIVFVTFVLRLLTFPLHYKSMLSMKKMQALRPQLDGINERFKGNPQKIQEETMKIFKKAKTNPLSGCWPLFLQMPFFLAFFKVLANSVELVGAPMGGWIHDLSAKDPYFILPILTGLVMFVQQLLTPIPTADPNQKKMMYIMPVVMCFFFVSSPAGLSLYFLTQTVLGILQQRWVNKVKVVAHVS